MFQGFARFAHFFVSESEVVVGVGVGGSELHCHLISLDALLYAAGLVENIAQIEIGQRVAGIGLQRGAVVLLGQREVLAIVVKRTEIDVCRGVVRLKFENALISR